LKKLILTNFCDRIDGMINFFDPKVKQAYREETTRLLQEPNPAVFRKDAKAWLNRVGPQVELALKVTTKNNEQVLEIALPVIQKIAEVAASQRYAIVEFKTDSYGHRIPTFDAITNSDDKKLIQCSIPEAPPFSIRSQYEANYVTRLLSHSGIPVHAPDACDAKAELSCQFIKAMGVSESAIEKIFITGNFFVQENPDLRPMTWHWHIAPVVTTEKNEKFGFMGPIGGNEPR
jgi:hypothetical protein